MGASAAARLAPRARERRAQALVAQHLLAQAGSGLEGGTDHRPHLAREVVMERAARLAGEDGVGLALPLGDEHREVRAAAEPEHRAAVVQDEPDRVREAARRVGRAEEDLAQRGLQLLRAARPDEEGGDEEDGAPEAALGGGEQRERVGPARGQEDDRRLAARERLLERGRRRAHPRQPRQKAPEPERGAERREAELAQEPGEVEEIEEARRAHHEDDAAAARQVGEVVRRLARHVDRAEPAIEDAEADGGRICRRAGGGRCAHARSLLGTRSLSRRVRDGAARQPRFFTCASLSRK